MADTVAKAGAPDRNRTYDLQIRNLTLYPTELQAHYNLYQTHFTYPAALSAILRYNLFHKSLRMQGKEQTHYKSLLVYQAKAGLSLITLKPTGEFR
jgi:hypothetical protein